MVKGKYLIVLMFVLGICLGSFGWWHRKSQGRLVLGAWSSNAVLVRHAPKVILLSLSRSDSDGNDDAHKPEAPAMKATSADAPRDPDFDRQSSSASGNGILQIGNRSVPIAERHDLSNTPGLVHARHAMIEDFNYEWASPIVTQERQWDFALLFVDGEHQATVAFDLSTDIVCLVEAKRELQMKPELTGAFRKKFTEWRSVGLPVR